MTREAHPCLFCGEPTTNAKFCSRKCVAEARRAPRDSADGLASDPLNSKERDSDGFMTVRGPDQAEVRVKPRRFFVGSQVVFRPSSLGRFGEGFSQDSKCGDFLETLVGILASEPEYLRTCDLPRHIGLIHEFGTFQFLPFRFWGEDQVIPVSQASLIEIKNALEWWVNHLVRRHENILMPSFALDTGSLIVAHLDGKYLDSGHGRLARLEGLLPEEERWGLDWPSKSEKREVTERIKGFAVRAVVPDDERLMYLGRDTPLLFQGDEFLYVIDRCHLSSSVSHTVHAYPSETAGPEYELEKFLFPGFLMLRTEYSIYATKNNQQLREEMAVQATEMIGAVPAEVPARWFQTLLIPPTGDEAVQEMEVPKWIFV